jgi:KipI family sensor histidine kinase inhibitor
MMCEELYTKVRYLPAGDRAMIIEFGNTISGQIHKKVHGMMAAVAAQPVAGVLELVPAYRSLMVYYDPLIISWMKLCTEMARVEDKLLMLALPKVRVIEIPTVYGGDFGPDLAMVAEYSCLTMEEVIEIHTSVNYLIYMLGFTPGFPYLGGLPETIATPRRAIPRSVIPAGSVGIAGKQTGIYPIASPGGWQLIGRTPLTLYNPALVPPTLLQTGDYLRFCRICEEEYRQIEEQVASGRYEPIVYELG